MRILLSVMLLVVLALSGCSWMKAAKKPAKAQPRAGAPATRTAKSATNQAQVVTPANALVGKVALVNATARFVVLNFPLGKMAAAEQQLNLYRRGVKVGEVKVTGPQRGDNIVADLVSGEAEIGDEAQSQ
jgi:hypothetical protein